MQKFYRDVGTACATTTRNGREVELVAVVYPINENLKPGDRLRGCVKCMGLKKGQSPEVLGVIEVVSVRREPLSAIIAEGQAGADREGFPLMGPRGFVRMFCEHMGGDEDQEVTRIEYRYVEPKAEG